MSDSELPSITGFIDYLKRASATVKTWPEWKQGLLGGKTTPPPAHTCRNCPVWAQKETK